MILENMKNWLERELRIFDRGVYLKDEDIMFTYKIGDTWRSHYSQKTYDSYQDAMFDLVKQGVHMRLDKELSQDELEFFAEMIAGRGIAAITFKENHGIMFYKQFTQTPKLWLKKILGVYHVKTDNHGAWRPTEDIMGELRSVDL